MIPVSDSEKIAVRVKEVSKAFVRPDGKDFFLALDKVSFEVKKGSIVLISGSNGSGKSLLMKIIAGLTQASRGSVETSSKPGLVFQEASSQILGETVWEDVCLGPKNQKINRNEIPPIAEDALKQVSLTEKKDEIAEFLSGGEKRRLAVASILAMKKEILIFDEPYANLDYPGVKEVNALIKNLHKKNKTLILLTHEIEKCLSLADKVIILSKGKLVFEGSSQKALEENLEQYGIRNPLHTYTGLKDLIWE